MNSDGINLWGLALILKKNESNGAEELSNLIFQPKHFHILFPLCQVWGFIGYRVKWFVLTYWCGIRWLVTIQYLIFKNHLKRRRRRRRSHFTLTCSFTFLVRANAHQHVHLLFLFTTCLFTFLVWADAY